ncbi:MAG: hypothetical protein HC859_16670 [Bacteroidia bacterium]|nr:hypothetical protein [Bacteroidia bacterium]
MHGQELWTSNGSDAGTFMLKDIREGTTGGALNLLGTMNNQLFLAPMMGHMAPSCGPQAVLLRPHCF